MRRVPRNTNDDSKNIDEEVKLVTTVKFSTKTREHLAQPTQQEQHQKI
jgi:hypothetical protein